MERASWLMIRRLLVYGALQKGHPSAYLLEQIGGSWQVATVVRLEDGRAVDADVYVLKR